MKPLCILLILGSLMTGCASTTQLTAENHQKITNIYIEQAVKIPETAYYYGPEQGVGVVFGPVGMIIAQSVETNDELIAKYMKENDVDIGRISRNAVEKLLINNPKFASKKLVTEKDKADSVLKVEVAVYGLSQTHGFSSVYRPQLGIKARLEDQQGIVLWEDYEFVTAMNDGVHAIEFKEYFEDPNNMKVRYEKAAELVMDMMAEDL